jgi:hypothetical protein
MPPRQRRILHLAERTNPRRTPARQLRGDSFNFSSGAAMPTVETFPRMHPRPFHAAVKSATPLT